MTEGKECSRKGREGMCLEDGGGRQRGREDGNEEEGGEREWRLGYNCLIHSLLFLWPLHNQRSRGVYILLSYVNILKIKLKMEKNTQIYCIAGVWNGWIRVGKDVGSSAGRCIFQKVEQNSCKMLKTQQVRKPRFGQSGHNSSHPTEEICVYCCKIFLLCFQIDFCICMK